eukprot:6389262-Prorocentrum_lima.AAC.1
MAFGFDGGNLIFIGEPAFCSPGPPAQWRGAWRFNFGVHETKGRHEVLTVATVLVLTRLLPDAT